MSRGPGRIERAIRAAYAAEPDNAFTTDDLCDRIFAGVNRIEKKHRVSVIRALKAVAASDREMEFFRSEAQGGPLVLFNCCNVMSYAMARIKADSLENYRPTARRARGWWDAREMWVLPPAEQEACLRALLMPGGKQHHLVTTGGAWWEHTELARAKRRGDHERAQALEDKFAARERIF